MDIIAEIKEIIDKIDKIDRYIGQLQNKLVTLEEKQLDWLHYIESNKISSFDAYRMSKEMKKIRNDRRKVKQDIEIARKYSEQKNKMVSTVENRKLLLEDLYKRKKQLETTYKNRQYTEEEMQKILKGV